MVPRFQALLLDWQCCLMKSLFLNLKFHPKFRLQYFLLLQFQVLLLDSLVIFPNQLQILMWDRPRPCREEGSHISIEWGEGQHFTQTGRTRRGRRERILLLFLLSYSSLPSLNSSNPTSYVESSSTAHPTQVSTLASVIYPHWNPKAEYCPPDLANRPRTQTY